MTNESTVEVKKYEISESDIKEMGEEMDKGNIKDKVFSWFGKNLLDKTVTKDMKFSILKTFVNKLPIPKVEPPKFEDLMYQESIFLYKLRVVLNYVYQVEDNFAACIFSHEKDHLKRYRDITNNMFNFLIVLCESDSFYRHRVSYILTMIKSDMMLNHYFRLIREFGMEEEWKGQVIDIKLSPDSFFRNEQVKSQSKELQGIFSHLATTIKENTELKNKL